MKTIALTNQKGGVGKTTSTINIGAALAKLGKKVLLIDLDPQANLTYSLKMHSNRVDKNIYHALKGKATAKEAIIKHNGFDFIPSSLELSGAELELANEPAREGLLKNVLEQIKEDEYDFVLIDCPPNLGLLTLNAFTAVEDIFIVLQSEYLALHGLSKLLDLIKIVQQRLNNRLAVGGIICTLYDSRKNLNKEVVGHIQDYFGDKVFSTIIRDNVALAEAPSHHKTIFEYDEKSNGAKDYFALAKEIKNGH
ncbi:MAG TPA: chromosome partitioning protein ParA [Balneola sp.]|jgi:chromosome partitioning protein|nr:chromosome partitioning protein ParA [Bacteroidota bacterium]HCI69732.1 chromosome partitioning protein ParA [Balneola sp.]HCT53848.1 chromosome partitioning protein ParA [Balneola sp.]|tara:strand:+ start:8849 stop:9604 length:756 start_codon:yes stop_codon:yes gene_type:complete